MGNDVTHNLHVIHDEYDPHFCSFLDPKLMDIFHRLEGCDELRDMFFHYFIGGSWTTNNFKCSRVILRNISYSLPSEDTLEISEEGCQHLYVRDGAATAINAWKNRSPLAKVMTNFSATFPLLVANALMQFIQTKEYTCWLRGKSSLRLSETFRRGSSLILHPLRASLMLHNSSLSMDDHSLDSTVHRGSELDELVSGLELETSFTMPRIESILQDNITNLLMDHDHITKTFQISMLRSVLELLDNFPVSFAISSSRPNNHYAYPFVFVNKAFEALTQYKREEVLGKSWSFMQSEEHTEMNQDHYIRDTLREMLPLRLAITNVRKDGSSFTNLLALEPIVSYYSSNAYIIGVQYELNGNEKSMKYDLQVVEDFIKLISGILIC